jgi:hypothetical protein
MAKKKTFADVARTVRRQADTKIKQLERIKDNAKNEYVREGAERRIERIRQFASGTYYKDSSGKTIEGRSDEYRRRSLQALARELSSTRYASARGQRNLKSTQVQLNLASAGQESSMYTEAEAKIFYRATQRAWQREGIKPSERNKAILEYYGYENLSDLVSDVLTMNWKAVEASKKRVNYEDETEEQREARDENDVREAQSSPTYLTEVVSFTEPSGLEELEAV